MTGRGRRGSPAGWELLPLVWAPHSPGVGVSSPDSSGFSAPGTPHCVAGNTQTPTSMGELRGSVYGIKKTLSPFCEGAVSLRGTGERWG